MIVLLLLGVQDDAYIRGYAEALLEKEFALRGAELRVSNGVVVVRGDIPDPEPVMTALSKIDGVREVRFEEGPSTSSGWEFFPDWRLFKPLLADPRWPHFSAAFKRFSGNDDLLDSAAAVSFGEFFSLAGYDGRFELGVQAGVFATFDLDSESFDLINADYLIALPLAWREGDWSAQARIGHQSSHLGDEFLLRAAVDRVNLSYEKADVLLSWTPIDVLRLYGGAGYLVHTDPDDLKPLSLQLGLEVLVRGEWLSPVAAVDLQRFEESDSEVDVSARIGVEFRRPDTSKRRVLLLLEYYRGRNSDGQFYDEKIETIGIGLHLHF